MTIPFSKTSLMTRLSICLILLVFFPPLHAFSQDAATARNILSIHKYSVAVAANTNRIISCDKVIEKLYEKQKEYKDAGGTGLVPSQEWVAKMVVQINKMKTLITAGRKIRYPARLAKLQKMYITDMDELSVYANNWLEFTKANSNIAQMMALQRNWDMVKNRLFERLYDPAIEAAQIEVDMYKTLVHQKS